VPTLIVDTGTWRLEADNQAPEVTPHNRYIEMIVPALEAMNAVMPLTKFTFRTIGGDSNRYRYRLDTNDGRTWEQILVFEDAEDLNPKVTYELAGDWLLHQCTMQRDLRNYCVGARAGIGCTRLVVTWS
jgi:hypothetical protein